ncbi:two-component sensor histidine kinase [Actinoplanes philippinensis]|uniref:sensor histidine kinase n=1 Tax=Actinoplanes philippinensis TaxID=35752 RepID=UPI000B87E0E5|nr:histidine kinase [Actinoplanes philippinensis]GIE82312.1 two-component sensor histidine kinase [Actinoplanes philippinensis]
MVEPLRALLAEPRPPGPPARNRRDLLLAAALLVAVAVEGLVRTGLPDRAATVIMTAALVPTLLWRRERPLLTVVVVFGVSWVFPLLIGHQPELVSGAFVLLLAYAVVRWGSGREIVAGTVLILVKIAATARGADLVAGLLVMTAVFALAAAMRYRSRLRVREVDQVKLLERERLARDLHDTVAHHVSAMAIRAQAGIAVSRTSPEAAVDALRVIEAEAVRALGEMRTMVRALRGGDPAELTPSPAIADLAALAGPSPEGPEVTVAIDGELGDLSPAVGTAIFRLAQESVTNARRHGRHATRIAVRVSADAATVRLCVTDDGDGGTVRGGGFGLAGMRERAELLGGVCEAGPAAGRGWTVTAVLPRGLA